MNTLLTILAGGLGALIGSFLNVVIHRMPRDEPMGMSRSMCPRCGARIRWFDNIPLLSFLVLGGRCRDCRGRIALRYPFVEALCAALFALCAVRVRELGWTPGPVAWLVTAGYVAVLLAASFIDFAHKILPDRLTLRVGPVVALIGTLAVPDLHGTVLFGHELAQAVKPGLASLAVGLVGVAVGGGIIWGIRLLGTLLLRREAMGLGDVKLMATSGLLLGPGGALLAIGTAMVGGAVLGIVIWIVTRNREIPFGPFLAMGVVAALLYGGPIEYFVLEVYPRFVLGG